MAHEQLIYLFQMVIFYSVLYVYQRVQSGPPVFCWLRLYLITHNFSFDAGYMGLTENRVYSQ